MVNKLYYAERIEEAKLHILAIVARSLISRSEERLRIADVAAQAEVSASVLYSYFGSKEGLVDEAYLLIYKQQNQLILATVSEILAQLPTHQETFKALIARLQADPRVHNSNDFREMRMRIRARGFVNASFESTFEKLQNDYLLLLAKSVEGFAVFTGASIDFSHVLQSVNLIDTLLMARVINSRAAFPLDIDQWQSMVQAVEVSWPRIRSSEIA